jgi:hypothetical protein
MASDRERHTVYLSDTVWAELRKHAVLQPGQNAGTVIEYLLDSWLSGEFEVNVPARTRTDDTEFAASDRTLYLRPGLWANVTSSCKARGSSPSRLIEALLRRYLGLHERG